MNRDDELVLDAVVSGVPSPSGWVRVTCPFCVLAIGKPDRRRSFGVLIEEGTAVYNCFRCGTHGRVRNVPPDLLRRAPRPPETTAPPSVGPPEGFELIAEGPGATALSLATARAYLESRGIAEAALREARVGACLDGYWAGRVIVPVFGPDNVTWCGFVGRAWVKQAQIPYLYPRGMARGSVLYQQAVLAVETDEPVLVVEGVMDALHFPGRAVALLGKASHWHVEALAAARRPVAIVLDGDAWREGEALADRLRLRGVRAGSVRLPPRKDPDEVCKSWLMEEVQRVTEA